MIGIVAAAGSTATGAFDPLDELADLASASSCGCTSTRRTAAASRCRRRIAHKLAGIERADSVVWDAHKLLMMPALVTAVLFKQRAHAYEAFAQQASYLFADARPETHWWDLGTRTLECTKRMMAIELWTALRVHGEAWFGEVVDRQIALTPRARREGRRGAGLRARARRPSSTSCATAIATAPTTATLRRSASSRTAGSTSSAPSSRDGYYLRSTIMNPLTEESDLDELLEHLRALCR